MAIFAVMATTALAVMVFGYMRLPTMLGVGQYRVTVELPETGGLYPRGNVTYRGTEVGKVKSVDLTDTGVAGGAVAELGRQDPRRSRCRGAQRVRGRRAVRRSCCRAAATGRAEGRRRDPAGPHQGPDRHQHGVGRHQPRPAGDSARQPQDGRRRGLHRGRRARSGDVAGWSTGAPHWPSTPARTSIR